MSRSFRNFEEFYPYYLAEHGNRICRRLHFIGTTLVVLLLIVTVATAHAGYLLLVPLAGYGFAWAGHFFFEHNRPATFTHPVYSLMGDWVMWKDMLAGKIRF